MTFAAVGSATIDSTANTFTLAPATLGLSAGDFVVFSVYSKTYTDYATAMSSSNATWSVLVAHTAFGTTGVMTVFIGKITSTASETVTITVNSGSPTLRCAGWAFSTTAGYSAVALDTSGTVSSSTLDFPPLTPGHGSGELYFCFCYAAGTGFTAGSTSGYSYENDGSSNPLAFNADCASGVQQPVWSGTASDIYGIAVLLFEETLTASASLTVAPSFTAAAPPPPPAAALTVTPVLTASTGLRSQYEWPFTWDSIWNIPVSADAQYVPAGVQLTAPYTTSVTAVEYVCINPDEPVVSLTNALLADGDTGPADVYCPEDMTASGQWNMCGGFLASADNDTVYQGETTLRTTEGGSISWGAGSGDNPGGDYPSAATSITGTGYYGPHGGSGLSAVGGTLTPADLAGTGPITHAMKLELNGYMFYSQTGYGGAGYTWPAVSADTGYNESGNYAEYNGTNPYVVMGSLLALAPDIDPLTRYSDPLVQRIAAAMQAYGAYIVDNTGNDGVADGNIEINFDAVDYWTGTGTFASDFETLIADLSVIVNNTADTPGGGAIGSPRYAPYAPASADGKLAAPPSLTVVSPGYTALSGFTDDFSGASLDTANWESSGTVSVSGGECLIQADTSYDGGIYSAATWMLSGNAMAAEVTPYTGGTEPVCWFQCDDPAGNYAGIAYDAGEVYGRISQGGTETDGTAVAYNATAMKWWRVREASGTIYMEYAASASGSWTQLWSTTYTSFAPASVNVDIGAGLGSGTAGTMSVASFNVLPAVTAAAALTVTPSLAAAALAPAGAALTVSPSLTASAASTAGASLAVTPAFTAAGAGAAAASLTVTPSLSVFPAAVAGASLTVSPSAAVSEAGAGSVSLTVVPSLAAQETYTAAETPALTVAPGFTARGAAGAGGALTVTPVLTAPGSVLAPGTGTAALTVVLVLGASSRARAAAALTVAPALGAAVQAPVTAALAVAPVFGATAHAAAGASLTAAVAFAALPAAGTPEALTVSPGFTAAAQQGAAPAAALTVACAFAVTRSAGVLTALTVVPVFGAGSQRSGQRAYGLLMASGII